MAEKSIGRKPKTARGRSRRWPWLLLAIIVVALTAGFIWQLAGGQTTATTGAATGTSVPSVALPSTTDHPIALTDYRGKKLVVYFYEGST